MVAWFNSKIETIMGAAVILSAASFASKILGLLRNHVLASTFGAGDTLDAYYAAFRIPDAIFQFIVLGALSAGFIPIFVELMEKQKGDAHFQVAATILNVLFGILVIFAILFVIFAPYLQALIAPGFHGEKLRLAINLTRIMAFGPIFLGISAVFSGILQSYRRFAIYALAPLLYNVGIIVGALWLVPQFGVSGLAIGVVLGTLLHMVVQIPAVFATGFRWYPLFDFKNAAVKRIAWLSLPRVLGLAVTQINLFAITLIASKLSSGSLAVFNLANDIQSVPIGLFAVSLATAAFPAFSEFAARGDMEGFRNNFSSTMRLTLFLTVPFAVLFLLLRAQVVRVLLGAGEFDWSDTISTADTLAFFSLSLFAQALIQIVVRALFAMKNTLAPLLAGMLGVAVNIAGAVWLRDSFGVAGLALAFSFAMVVNLVALWLMLRFKVGSLDELRLIPAVLKISAAALLMALVVQSMKYVIAPYLDLQTGFGIFAQGFIAGMLGLAVFLMSALVMGSEEAQEIKNAFTKRLFREKSARPSEIVQPHE